MAYPVVTYDDYVDSYEMTSKPELDPRIEARVEVEQMDVSLRLVPFTVATSFSVVEVIILLFWSPGLRLYLFTLQFSLIVLSSISLWRCYKWRTNPKPAAITRVEFLGILAVAQLYGWVLGSVPWTLFEGADPNERLL